MKSIRSPESVFPPVVARKPPQVSVPQTFTQPSPPCRSSAPRAILVSAVSLMRKEGAGCRRWGPAHRGGQPPTSLLLHVAWRQCLGKCVISPARDPSASRVLLGNELYGPSPGSVWRLQQLFVLPCFLQGCHYSQAWGPQPGPFCPRCISDTRPRPYVPTQWQPPGSAACPSFSDASRSIKVQQVLQFIYSLGKHGEKTCKMSKSV